ncbi:hypothetical protein TorRG33x02_138600 [Trema orientale]|uniref:Uncharacterized protein n=1 Tax=Trema orientale TaxID=63057 RepID=A0A2P5EXY0_TREOI|nr:hypothetical protein TorRG33x02_138600 [Trema orientale]
MSLLPIKSGNNASRSHPLRILKVFGFLNTRSFMVRIPCREKRLSITSHWKPPSFGCLKLNVDADVPKNGDRAGIGVVIRDHLD